jgi:hypothetical protein
MIIIDYINRLLGKPPLLPNGYPDVARTVARRVNGGEQQRWNAPGGFYMPPPPPIPMYPTRNELPQTPMVSEIVNKIISEPVRTTPSTTSSLWCGSTITDVIKKTEEKDPYIVDHLPLKRMLMKTIPWIVDVTGVKVKKFHGTGGMPKIIDGIMSGQLEIYITVSPTHHSELMNPKIEVEVREKLFIDLLPLITCMYPNNSFMPPVIIFSPSHSETILEHVK